MRILLIEDDQTLGATLERALHRRGHDVDLVRSITGAREYIDITRYDVIVSDRDVLDGNAWTFICGQELGTPVVLMTADITAQMPRLRCDDGFSFWAKGLDTPQDLFKLIERK